MTRKDGKKTFLEFEKKGKDFYPVGRKMSSVVASAAAKKIATRIFKATGKTSGITLFMRKAGVYDRVRKYTAEISNFVLVEPNSDLNRGAHGRKPNTEEFAGTEPDFVMRNEYFAKHPLNPKTKEAWTEAEAAERNAELTKDGILKLLPGKHIVYRSKVAKVKYIEVVKLPEGTVLHPDEEEKEEEEKVPAKPEKKAKGKKAKKETTPVKPEAEAPAVATE